MSPGSFTKHLKSQLLPLPHSKRELAQLWCLPAGHSPALTSGRVVWIALCFSRTSLPILQCLCIRLTCWALCFKIKNLGHFTSMKSSSQTELWLVKESFYFFSVNVTTFPGYSIEIFNYGAGWNFFKREGYFTTGTKVILFSWTYIFVVKTIKKELTKKSIFVYFQMCFYKFFDCLAQKKITQNKPITNKTPKKPKPKQSNKKNPHKNPKTKHTKKQPNKQINQPKHLNPNQTSHQSRLSPESQSPWCHTFAHSDWCVTQDHSDVAEHYFQSMYKYSEQKLFFVCPVVEKAKYNLNFLILLEL